MVVVSRAIANVYSGSSKQLDLLFCALALAGMKSAPYANETIADVSARVKAARIKRETLGASPAPGLFSFYAGSLLDLSTRGSGQKKRDYPEASRNLRVPFRASAARQACLASVQ